MAQLQDNLLILEQQSTLTNSSRWPRLRLFAGWRWGRPGLNQTRDEWMDYGIIGAQSSWTIWEGGSRRLENRALSASKDALRHRIKGVAAQLETEYASALTLYHAEQSELALLQQDLELVRMQLRGLEARLEQGDIAGSDLRDRLLELTRVQTEEIMLRLEICLQKTEIEKLSGLPPAEWSLQ